MKKLVVSAFAFAFATVLSAFAGTQVNWFNGGIGAAWPNDDSMVGGEWSAVTASSPADLTAGYTAEKGIELDAGDDQLQFTAEVGKTLGEGTDSITVTSQMQLYPFADVPATVEEGAKAGVILVTTEGGAYVYGVREKDGATPAANEWYKLSDTVVNPEDMATVTITAAKAQADGKLSVAYSVTVGSAVEIAANATVLGEASIEKAAYTGSGFVKTLSSTAVSETKEFAIDAVALSNSYVQVVSVTGTGVTYDSVKGKWVVPYGESATVTFGAIDGYVAPAKNTHVYAYTDIADISAKPTDVDTPEKGKARIGTTWYLSLNDAMDAAAKGAEIVLGEIDAVKPATFEGPGLSIADNKYGKEAGEGLTIDFNNNTYVFTSGKGGEDDPRAIYILKNNKITLKNGTLKAAKAWADKVQDGETNVPFGEFIRSFANEVTLDNMELNATNMMVSNGRGIQFLNGNVNIINGTKLLKPITAGVTNFYAVKQGDYTASYAMGTLTLNTSAAFEGNFLFCGGSATKTAATLDADAKFYFGHTKGTLFDPANFTGFGFKAYTGTIATEKATDTSFHTDGQIFTTAAAAITGIEDYATVTLLADVDTEDLSVPTGKTLVAGAYSFKSAELDGTAKVTASAQIVLSKFSMKDSPAGKEVKETVDAGVYTYAIGLKTFNITYTYVDTSSQPVTGVSNTNPTTFTIETADITFDADKVSKDGYTSASFSPTGIECSEATADVNVTVTLTPAPQGTTFTISSLTGCEAAVTIAGEAATAPYVVKSGETIVFTLTATGTPTVPSYKGQVGNTVLNNTDFDKGAYSFTVDANTPATIDCTFAIIDAGSSPSVTPTDVVPADTDANKVASAASNIDKLATKSGETTADVGLTQKIAKWINGKKISGNAIAAVGTEAQGALTTEQFEEAFLLNCDTLSADAITAAKAAFKFEGITPGTKPTIDKTYNGTLSYKGSDDLKVWETATDNHKFYKAELTK